MKIRKYRAFHKPTNKMFNVGMLDFLYETVYEYTSHGLSSSDAVELYDFNECELMQFTEWQDDSPIKIDVYEGDIVEVEFKEEYSDEIVVIEEDAKNRYKVIFEDGCFFLTSKKAKYYLALYALGEIDIDIKVLGNIYENKELLGEYYNEVALIEEGSKNVYEALFDEVTRGYEGICNE